DLIESISVNVSDRNAIMAVDVNSAGAIQHGTPVIGSAHQLRRIALIAAQRRGSNIRKARIGRTTAELSQRLPLAQLELTGGCSNPFQFPNAHPLFAMESRAFSHQLEPDSGGKPSGYTALNPRNQKFGGYESRKFGKVTLEFGQKLSGVVIH